MPVYRIQFPLGHIARWPRLKFLLQRDMWILVSLLAVLNGEVFKKYSLRFPHVTLLLPSVPPRLLYRIESITNTDTSHPLIGARPRPTFRFHRLTMLSITTANNPNNYKSPGRTFPKTAPTLPTFRSPCLFRGLDSRREILPHFGKLGWNIRYPGDT